MSFEYQVAGKHTFDMAGGRLTLASLEMLLRQLQADGEIYIRNVDTTQKSLVEMWVEVNRQSELQKIILKSA